MKQVGIIGSCVTRDAFELDYPRGQPWSLAFYAARTSLASGFSVEPFPLTIEELDPDGAVEGDWQRRMIEQDLSRTLPASIRQHDPTNTAIVVDLVDEKADLLHLNGSVATYSVQLRAKAAPHQRFGLEIIPSGSEEHFSLWKQGFARLLDVTRDFKVLLNNSLWAYETEEGTPTRDRSYVDRNNDMLRRCYDHAISAGLQPLFEPSYRSFIAAREHRWGVAPYHYTERVYRDLLDRLSAY